VWNSVDPSRFTPDGPRLDLDAKAGMRPPPPGAVRVGLLATFARWKGHTLFLEAIRSLHERHNLRAYIIGGPLAQTDESQYSINELRGILSRMQLAQVVGLTGFANDPATAIRGLDIVVHASTAPEPFGLVVAEAMASGRAVVASSGGGVAELVSNDQDGLTYAQGDASALTRQIERLLLDASLRRRLGAAARLRAQAQFSPDRARGEILALYEQFEKVAAA
jgi:glycosyltransferase involved in cell wall biosynthesis